jgi:tetratricopeptide (TPR) repeat protein
VRIADVHLAFPNAQLSGTRLVLTQSTYTLQKWLDTLADGDAVIVSASREALEENAPESFRDRGPWRQFAIVDLGPESRGLPSEAGPEPRRDWAGHPLLSLAPSAGDQAIAALLARAYHSASAAERVQLCRRAAAEAPDSAAAALALSSASRELQDLAGARAALDSAIRLAPDWEAVWYEDGKFWLGGEDLERAREAFQRAAELMPSFSAAFANLGATLGELDRPEEALAAVERALAADPDNVSLLNNLGVVNREIGRLDRSEEICRRVVGIEPGFVFGHYNLGHALFLAGRFAESLASYEEGQRRDPEKNRRQACRLAIVRLACGDPAGAERDLWRAAGGAPSDEREDLLLEAYEIALALVRARADLPGGQAFLERLATKLSR